MGRYFFHLKAQGHLEPDDTGVELLDAEAAFEEAVKAAQDMARDAALGGKDISGQSFEVTAAEERKADRDRQLTRALFSNPSRSAGASRLRELHGR